MFLDRLGLRPHGRCLGVCPGMLQKSLESFPAGPTFGNSLRPLLPVLHLLDELVFPIKDRLELIVADPLGQVAQVSQVRSPGQWWLSPRQLTKRLHAVKELGGALRFLAWLHVQPDVVENLSKLDQLGCGENDVLTAKLDVAEVLLVELGPCEEIVACLRLKSPRARQDDECGVDRVLRPSEWGAGELLADF